MRIDSITLYQTNRIIPVHLQKKHPVNFCGEQDSVELSSITYPEAKKNIQLKYKDAISKLRAEKKQIRGEVDKKLTAVLTGDKSLASDIEWFYRWRNERRTPFSETERRMRSEVQEELSSLTDEDIRDYITKDFEDEFEEKYVSNVRKKIKELEKKKEQTVDENGKSEIQEQLRILQKEKEEALVKKYDEAEKKLESLTIEEYNNLKGKKIKELTTEKHRFLEEQLRIKKSEYELDKIYKAIGGRGYFVNAFEKYKHANCIMIISKDKQLSQDVLDFSEFYCKMDYLLPHPELSDEQMLIEKGAIHRIEFRKLKDTFAHNCDFQQALYDALGAANENYQKTGRNTILNVENMERLLQKTLSHSNIAVMKDAMSSANEDFHTTITFTTTDPNKCNPGTIVSHRVNLRYDLDALGIDSNTLKMVKAYTKNQNKMDEMMSKASQIYREGSERYIALTAEIEKLRKQCRDEVASLNKKAFKPVTKTPSTQKPISVQTTEEAGKFMKRYKIPAIGGLVLLFAAAGGIMYKKGIFKKTTPADNLVNTQSLKQVSGGFLTQKPDFAKFIKTKDIK